MAVYPLTDKLRSIFKRHAINSPELEQELSEVMIPVPDKPKGEVIDIEPIMPVIEPDPEQLLYRKMYPSLAGKKRV